MTRTLEARTRRVADQARALEQTLRLREEAELNLREAEAGYQALLEQLLLAVYIRGLDVRTSNVYVSPQVEPMLGYPADLWRDDPDLIKRVIHPDDLDRVLDELAAVRKTGEPLRTEYRCIASDGRIVWVEDLTFLVRDENGTPQNVQGFLLDITERKNAEESMVESEEKFRTLVSNVPGIVFRCELDADWTMHFISETIEQISGYPATDFIETRSERSRASSTRTTWTSSRERWTKPSPPTARTRPNIESSRRTARSAGCSSAARPSRSPAGTGCSTVPSST